MNHLIVIPTQTEACMLAKRPKTGTCLCIRDCGNCKGQDCQDKVFLLITGGIARSCIRPIQHAVDEHKIAAITLLGFAGNLTSENRLGKTYLVRSVTNRDEVISVRNQLGKTHCPIDHNGYATLITVNKPVYTKERKLNLSNYAELVDMEGFHIADLCRQREIQFCMIRIVSDNCDTDLRPFFMGDTANRDFPVQLLNAQKRLAEIVNKLTVRP